MRFCENWDKIYTAKVIICQVKILRLTAIFFLNWHYYDDYIENIDDCVNIC